MTKKVGQRCVKEGVWQKLCVKDGVRGKEVYDKWRVTKLGVTKLCVKDVPKLWVTKRGACERWCVCVAKSCV